MTILRSALIAFGLIVGAAVYWLGVPRFAFYQFREVVQGGDVEQIAAHIDFPALRLNLKEHLKQQAGAGHPLQAALGSLIAGTIGVRAIDSMVTPEGLRAALAGGAQGDPSWFVAAFRGLVDANIDKVSYSMAGPLTAAVAVESPVGPLTAFLALDGTAWKLVGIQVPRSLISGR